MVIKLISNILVNPDYVEFGFNKSVQYDLLSVSILLLKSNLRQIINNLLISIYQFSLAIVNTMVINVKY